jgi:hypothetical protein
MPVRAGARASFEPAAQKSMRPPMVTVRSSGSSKYSAGLAALWAGWHDGDLRQEVRDLVDVERVFQRLLLCRQTKRGRKVSPVMPSRG